MSGATVFFTTSYPFNEDYALKFGFETLRRRGHSPRILNVMDLLLPPRAVAVYDRPEALEPVQGVAQERVRTLAALEKAVSEAPHPRLVVLASIFNGPLLRAIARTGTQTMRLLTNHQPAPAPPPLAERATAVLRKALFDPARFFDETLAKRLPRSWAGVPTQSFIVRGSEIEPRAFPPGTRVIDAHSFDYDRVLLEAGSARHPGAPAGEYFVHLECPPWECHDYKVMGLKAAVSKEEYGRLIRAFFDFVEAETGRPVVVSAHPKHTAEEDVYGGRPFLHGSEPLIRHSSGVFCHYSGALKFAVIHRKPLRFLNSRRLAGDRYFQTNLAAYAGGLRAPVRMVDTDADRRALRDEGFFAAPGPAYDEYMRLYVRTDAGPARPLWETIADALEASWR